MVHETRRIHAYMLGYIHLYIDACMRTCICSPMYSHTHAYVHTSVVLRIIFVHKYMHPCLHFMPSCSVHTPTEWFTCTLYLTPLIPIS